MQIYFSTDDEEAYHQALVLVGDKKALAIETLRKKKIELYTENEFNECMAYMLGYIDAARRQGTTAYHLHCQRLRGISKCKEVPRSVWKAMITLADSENLLEGIVPLGTIPIIGLKNHNNLFEKKDDKHLPPS